MNTNLISLDNDVFISIGLQLIASLLCVVMICYLILKGKKNRLFFSFLGCQILAFVWAFFTVLETLARNATEFCAFTYIYMFGVCFIGPAWLIFCLSFSNSKLLNKKYFIPLLLLPATFFYLSLLSNSFHHLFYTKMEYRFRLFGALFWAHTVETYSFLLIGSIILLINSIKQFGHMKMQAALLISAFLIPLAANFLQLFNVIHYIKIDLASITFSFSLGLIFIAIFRYRLLNIVPIALIEAMNYIKESILIIDSNNNIVDHNPSFAQNFGNITSIDDNLNLDMFIKDLSKYMYKKSKRNIFNEILSTNKYPPCVESEFCLEMPEKRYFNFYVRPIVTKNKISIGKVITFSDITHFKNLLNDISLKNAEISEMNEELTAMNEELIAMNEQLKEHTKVVEELAVANERNRMAREVHDTSGHTMTLIITLMKVSKIALKKDPDEVEKNLNQAIDIAVNGLKELRSSVAGLMPEKLADNNITSILGKLVRESESTGVEIELSVYGEEYSIDFAHSDTLYRICQEAITNSIRHGNASKVVIVLKFFYNKVQLFIVDDGIGCKKIKKGFGLSGMAERVNRLKGSISYGSSGDKGFNIHIEFPIGVESIND